MGILKDLFIELFSVNHLMLDMIDELENQDYGETFLTEFFINQITTDYSLHELIKYLNEDGYSVLNEIGTKKERIEFLKGLYR